MAETSQATQACRCGCRASQSSWLAAAAAAAKSWAACRRSCQPAPCPLPAMMAMSAALRDPGLVRGVDGAVLLDSYARMRCQAPGSTFYGLPV